MKKQRLLLAALIFSISGWVNASVPVIKLLDHQKAEVNFYSLRALNNYFFGTKDNTKQAEISAGNGVQVLQPAPVSPRAFSAYSGQLTPVENISTVTNYQVSAGSFSSYASAASSSSSDYFAPVSEAGSRRYGIASPALKGWAVVLLVLGCVMYQGRRRQRPIGFQKLD